MVVGSKMKGKFVAKISASVCKTLVIFAKLSAPLAMIKFFILKSPKQLYAQVSNMQTTKTYMNIFVVSIIKSNNLDHWTIRKFCR